MSDRTGDGHALATTFPARTETADLELSHFLQRAYIVQIDVLLHAVEILPQSAQLLAVTLRDRLAESTALRTKQQESSLAIAQILCHRIKPGMPRNKHHGAFVFGTIGHSSERMAGNKVADCSLRKEAVTATRCLLTHTEQPNNNNNILGAPPNGCDATVTNNQTRNARARAQTSQKHAPIRRLHNMRATCQCLRWRPKPVEVHKNNTQSDRATNLRAVTLTR